MQRSIDRWSQILLDMTETNLTNSNEDGHAESKGLHTHCDRLHRTRGMQRPIDIWRWAQGYFGLFVRDSLSPLAMWQSSIGWNVNGCSRFKKSYLIACASTRVSWLPSTQHESQNDTLNTGTTSNATPPPNAEDFWVTFNTRIIHHLQFDNGTVWHY